MSLLFEAFIALAIAAAVYMAGRHDGRAICKGEQSEGLQQAEATVKTEARADIKRSAATGTAREGDRAHVDAFFNRLAEEARHATPDPVDSCVLPDERLRRWAAANAGRADQGAGLAQPDGAAAAPAATGLGPGAGPGGEPPRSGAPISPAGQPDVPPAGLPADQPRRLQAVPEV